MRSMSKEHRLGYRPDGTHWREKSNAQVEAQNSQRKFRFDLDHKKALDTCLSHEGETERLGERVLPVDEGEKSLLHFHEAECEAVRHT